LAVVRWAEGRPLDLSGLEAAGKRIGGGIKRAAAAIATKGASEAARLKQ
jgi:hypothetical protein